MRSLLSSLVLLASAMPPAVQAQSTFAERGGSFATHVEYPAGAGVYTAVAADFNADGKRDLATGNADGDSISILLGKGDGSFEAATTLPAGDGSESLVAADFNGDGKADIAVPNLWASTVSVFLGNGNGGFAAAVPYTVGTNPHALVTGDFNADGKLDLASANGSAGGSLLRGTGTGTFLPEVPVVFDCINPRDLVAADFNGNGTLDLAVTCQGASDIAVVLGDGQGGFGAPLSVAVGLEPFGITAGKVDAGNTVDLVVGVVGSDQVAVLLGDGSGGFASAPPITVPRPLFPRIADLDADGHPDLVVIRDANQVAVFMGLGNGGFSAATLFPTAGGNSGGVLADLDADGKLDLAIAARAGDAVSVLLNTSAPPLDIAPSATVEASSSYSFRKPPIWINRQLATTYQIPKPYPYSHAGYLDLDRDGDTDFVRTFADNTLRYPIQVMVNDGNGNFSDQTASRIVGSQPGTVVARKVLVGDYDNDGWPDVLVLGHGYDVPPFPGEYPQLFLSNGDGTLSYSPALEGFVGGHHGGASADVDGNGTVDIMTNEAPPFLLLNDGQGGFTRNFSRLPVLPGASQFSPIASEFADVDGDGFIDLVADGYEPWGMDNAVYWGTRHGVYAYSNRSVLAAVPDMGITLDFAIEDIDHDGLRDVVVLRTGSTAIYVGSYIQVLRQASPRVFVDETAARFGSNAQIDGFDYIRLQDFNGDGFVDLLVDDKFDVGSGHYAWTNDGNGVFSPHAGAIVLPEEQRLSVADASISEGNAGSKQLDFTISLLRPAAAPVTFDAYAAPGTARPGTDYGADAMVGATVPAGQTSVTFPVVVMGDTEVEGHESFTVNLANVVGARRGDGQALGRIINDDLAHLGIADASLTEGDSGAQTLSFVVQLSQPMPNPVTFDIATSNGTATAGSDYVARSQAGRFVDAGRTRLVFEVEVKGDALVEPNETFTVTLSNVSGAALGDGVAVGTIVNDDAAAKPRTDAASGGRAKTQVRRSARGIRNN